MSAGREGRCLSRDGLIHVHKGLAVFRVVQSEGPDARKAVVRHARLPEAGLLQDT